MRYLMRKQMFSIGDDFWIEDESGQRTFRVDGKVLRIPPGVLHGWRNHTSEEAVLMYHISEKYDPANPDEIRYSLKEVGADWSTPAK